MKENKYDNEDFFINMVKWLSLIHIFTFKSWLSKVDKDTRKQAIESIFNILDAIKIEKVNDCLLYTSRCV